MEDVEQRLRLLEIPYTGYDHVPVRTVGEARTVKKPLAYAENKNLFLRNEKGTKHYLVTLAADKKLDLADFAAKVGEKKISFASPERLKRYLGVEPGAVSPFGLLNDTEAAVEYFFDTDLLREEVLGFHPNVNTRTIVLSLENVKKFVGSLSNRFVEMDF